MSEYDNNNNYRKYNWHQSAVQYYNIQVNNRENN